MYLEEIAKEHSMPIPMPNCMLKLLCLAEDMLYCFHKRQSQAIYQQL